MLSVFTDMVYAGAWEDRRSRLDKVAIYDHFRIFYSLSGKDALSQKRQLDTDGNGIADFIENVGGRLIEADRFFRHEVGLRPPLKSRRYIGRAHYIDINVLAFNQNSTGPKNGVAYDGTPKFNRAISGQVSLNVLAIDLSSAVRLESNSVEHELFHLYQNGYTFFKNRWYTEGTARWSELIMKGRIGRGGALPASTTQKEELFKQTYGASKFWNELIIRTDRKALGKRFIKQLFERLHYADDMAARDRGIKDDNWKESEQKSEENNIYIWNAIIEVVKSIDDEFSNDVEVQNLRRI